MRGEGLRGEGGRGRGEGERGKGGGANFVPQKTLEKRKKMYAAKITNGN